MKHKTVTLQINKALPGYAKGATVVVDVDKNGVPLNRFWRDRLHDAKTDHCVEIVKTGKASPKETIK